MRITIEIELGNAAMQTGLDVAEALREVAERLEYVGLDATNNTIADVNGNTVGGWVVAKSEVKSYATDN